MSNPAHDLRHALAFRILVLVAFAFLAAPATSQAHALFGDNDPNRPLVEYLWLGFGHMVGGWDHLLFIGGVVLLAGSWRSAAKLISLFVAGHSLTLLVATIAGWQLDATLVDVVIALSLVYVGVQGIRGRPGSLKAFGAVVFAFGLVHGLGLSTRLQDLGLPDDGVVARVVVFNVGVEAGQLVALAIIVGLGTLLARGLRDRPQAARYAFGAVALSGLLAAAVISFPGADPDGPSAGGPGVAGAGATGTGCTQRDTPTPRFIGGEHPAKRFFEPGEQARVEDLVHVIGDGLVIVRYRPDMPTSELARLRAFVLDPASRFVIGAPDPDQAEAVRTVAARRTMTCTQLDVEGLTRFRDGWLAEVREEQQSSG